VTEPSTDEAEADAAVTPAARGGGGRRSLAVGLLLGVVGASVLLLAAGKTWMHGTAAFAGGSVRVSASGSEVTALPGALALVGLAALVAVFAVRGAGRVIVAGLLALSGAGAVAAALLALGDTSALDAAASTATSVAHSSVSTSSTTAWPLVAATGGALLLAAGVIALVRGRAWPGMSNRYDRDGAEPRPRKQRVAAVDPDRPEDLWKALDRGEDPTEAGDAV
jgi:uncharacterized membrane protein (TIGR02234 family)